ncbi:MAG: type II toxin-antitoxin system Phd/YefM family antitoxin [Parachlamydiales bacterium]
MNPHFKHISSSDMRECFPELADEVRFNKDRIIVTRRGKNLVAIVPIEDLETLEAAEDRRDLEEARLALGRAKKEGTIAWEKVKKGKARG